MGRPRLMPTPTCCTEDTVWDTTATGPTATPTPMDTTARGPLRPSPRPRLTPGWPMDMVLVTTTAMLDTPMPTATTDTTARGLLRPRPSPRLMPTPTCCTADTVWDTTATGPTATPTDTTARGLLMPSPRPSPTTTADTTVATPVPTTVDTDTEPTGDK